MAQFLADESCDFAIVRALRAAGHNVTAIAEDHRGAPDETVIALSVSQARVLITEDTDFGQLVFAHGHASAGVILIRFPGARRGELAELVVQFVEQFEDQLIGVFVVMQPGRIRIGRTPTS